MDYTYVYRLRLSFIYYLISGSQSEDLFLTQSYIQQCTDEYIYICIAANTRHYNHLNAKLARSLGIVSPGFLPL